MAKARKGEGLGANDFPHSKVSGEGHITDEEIDAYVESHPELTPHQEEDDSPVELRINGHLYTREQVREAVLKVMRNQADGKRIPGISIGEVQNGKNVRCPERGCDKALSDKRIKVQRDRTNAEVSFLLAHILRDHPQAKKLTVGLSNTYKAQPDRDTVDAKKLLSVLFGSKSKKKSSRRK